MRIGQIVILLCLLIFISACSGTTDEATAYQDQYEIIGDEKDELLEDLTDPVVIPEVRGNPEAEEIIIDGIDQEGVEFNASPGRYEITGSITGNLYIYDEHDHLLFHNIIGRSYGVESITVDLDESYTIIADGGFDMVHAAPSTHDFNENNHLTAGVWEVGTDIEPGDYQITTSNGMGFLQIYDSQTDEPKIHEVIGGEFGATKGHVQLEDGQILRITEISQIHFEPL
ncbi:hypothetical protein [Alkalibacillus aidingensis]|uniref:hypothetical protein n=1 Tax=Alkalibacillus aidingensis TaxID=2747607 RepID=UPI00166123B8|nr:hypothetical protein [Alkalibacillus aidingensis]